LAKGLRKSHPFLSDAEASRLARLYGTRARHILGTAKNAADLGEAFGSGLTEAELRYLIKEEWVRDASDVLWRRSKLGLKLDQNAQAKIEQAIARQVSI
jgi:glycerol-3-phosphate dehydrogenase